MFDEIIDAGLFADLGNRMGNKVANYKNVRSTLDSLMDEKGYYLSLIEDFSESDKKEKHKSNYNLYIFLIVFIVAVYVYLNRSS